MWQKVMPDDHSKLVPLLPISNRTVKRLSADDSADSRVKVGHRQAFTARNAPPLGGAFCFVFPLLLHGMSHVLPQAIQRKRPAIPSRFPIDSLA